MATMVLNFRQMARLAGLALRTLPVCGVLWVVGILWYIVREIIIGVFQMAISVMTFILSLVVLLGFILWLFTL